MLRPWVSGATAPRGRLRVPPPSLPNSSAPPHLTPSHLLVWAHGPLPSGAERVCVKGLFSHTELVGSSGPCPGGGPGVRAVCGRAADGSPREGPTVSLPGTLSQASQGNQGGGRGESPLQDCTEPGGGWASGAGPTATAVSPPEHGNSELKQKGGVNGSISRVQTTTWRNVCTTRNRRRTQIQICKKEPPVPGQKWETDRSGAREQRVLGRLRAVCRPPHHTSSPGAGREGHRGDGCASSAPRDTTRP